MNAQRIYQGGAIYLAAGGTYQARRSWAIDRRVIVVGGSGSTTIAFLGMIDGGPLLPGHVFTIINGSSTGSVTITYGQSTVITIPALGKGFVGFLTGQRAVGWLRDSLNAEAGSRVADPIAQTPSTAAVAECRYADYRLVNCNDATDVIYTTGNFSQRIGKYVKLNTGEDWYLVELWQAYVSSGWTTVTVVEVSDVCIVPDPEYDDTGVTSCLNTLGAWATVGGTFVGAVSNFNCEWAQEGWADPPVIDSGSGTFSLTNSGRVFSWAPNPGQPTVGGTGTDNLDPLIATSFGCPTVNVGDPVALVTRVS